jgi:hypothetical protein
MRNYVPLLKRLAAILIMASLFMPLTQCTVSATEYINDDGTAVVKSDGSPRVDYQYMDLKPFEFISLRWDGLLLLFAFVWPILFQIFVLFAKTKPDNRWVQAIESLLIVLTAVQISYWVYCGDGARYGAYVAYSGLAIYLSALIVHLRRAKPNYAIKGTSAWTSHS